MAVTVLLVDDHALVRSSLRRALPGLCSAEVIGEAGDGRTGVRLALELRPDLILMDVVLPELMGVEATRQIIAAWPEARILAFSGYRIDRYVLEAFNAGARGFLLKLCQEEELVAAVAAVMAGRLYITPYVAASVVARLAAAGPPCEVTCWSGLTAREREVLQLIAEGKPTRVIAGTLHLSVKTIESHREHLMFKLDKHSVAELTLYAAHEGLVAPPPCE